MSRYATSDEVLRMIVGIRLEVGVDMSEIRDLIDKFSSDQRPREATGETAGFLSVEDIPQHLRREFAAALAALSGQDNYRQSPGAARTLSVTDIWG